MHSSEIPPTTPASAVSARAPILDRRRRPYQPALGPRLKLVLWFIFTCVALLGATGIYLLAIRLMEWGRNQTFTNQFTLWMFIGHVGVGLVLVLPFLIFGGIHLATARNRPNRLAVRLGLVLFILGILVGISGLALIQLEGLPQLPTGTAGRLIVYWLHLLTPIAAVACYVLHRQAGPDIQWRYGVVWGVAVTGFVAVIAMMHARDPRQWYAVGPREGQKYFEPSRARTATGNFIPAATLMMDDYCLKCHKDVYGGWFHSAHHFSSFNNPPYRFSVRETRQVSLARDGNTQPSRWCAGCHDPVPFFSGAFDDPNFDDEKHPTAHAGITCTVCHAITNVNSTVGNADYTIEEPEHYPFSYSSNSWLQWINNQLVKAKPDFHKKTFLKSFHRSAEFCSTCHKVSLPIELNHYKEFLRGQNHYDPYLLSGVSGHGARSFYYPPEAKTRCAECHAPLKASNDFGSRDFDGSGVRKIHDHLFPAANTGLPWLLSLEPGRKDNAEGLQRAMKAHADFLTGTDPEGKDRKLRIDLFGLKEGDSIDGRLHAPLRPELPQLKPGRTYLVEVVLRTLNMGHPFPQGTADSNEIWVEFQARSGDRLLGQNGQLSGPGDAGTVDPWAHFVNVLMLDRNGNRINRRNPQDIFTPLYDHQIPPGAAQVIHYRLQVPTEVTGPVELNARLRYRKFDHEYLSLVYAGVLPQFPLLLGGLPPHGSPMTSIVAALLNDRIQKVPQTPIIDLCADRIVFPVEGVAPTVAAQTSPIKPAWQRWNDYGIGCFLEGGAGSKRGELRQAEQAFRQLLALPDKDAHGHAHVNLARVLFDEGRLPEATEALNKARAADPPAPWWTLAWFTGLVNAQNGHLDAAIASFEQILDPKNQPVQRRFDFSLDYVVRTELGNTLFRRSQQEDDRQERDRFLRRAIAAYEATLRIDPEDLDAHYGLAQCYSRLGEDVRLGTGTTAAISEASIREMTQRLLERGSPRDSRLQAARELMSGLAAFGALPSDPTRRRLPVFLDVIQSCRKVLPMDAEAGTTMEREQDPEVQAALCAVLGQLYRQTHLIFKPDDNARDRTMRLYRQSHPAADAASQAVVIYPVHPVQR